MNELIQTDTLLNGYKILQNPKGFMFGIDAILLANHGALTVGVDLEQAYYRMETLEHYAKTAIAVKVIGGASLIPKEKIMECCELSKSYPVRHPGYKKYNF